MFSKKFNSLLDFSDHLFKAATSEVFAFQKGLEIASLLIQRDAKKQIGHLQPQVGTFNAWDELADTTKDEKERLGYKFNSDYNPLLRTGYLRDSIEYEIDMPKLEAVIGSKYDVAAFQEFGTRTIPPRPFIGPAMFKNMDKIAQIFGECAIRGIAGGRIVAEDIGRIVGYHQDIKL